MNAHQLDLFGGEPKTVRAREDKTQGIKPLPMFKAAEVLQFGVKARPTMPLGENAVLRLESEDPRTEEQKAADAQREAERNNQSFA